MNSYNKIHIYLRACHTNKPNNARPPWFAVDKCFRNLLNTTSWGISELTVIFDGDPKDTLSKKLQEPYQYKLKVINTREYTGYSYEPNCFSSKSLCLVSEIIKNDNLPDNSIIGIFENDYLFLPNWSIEVLDLYNNFYNYTYRDPELHFVSLYHHPDKFMFTNPKKQNEWGMYSNLESKIFPTKFRYWRYLPSITSTWIMTKQLFDKNYDLFSKGYSDNTACGEFLKRGFYMVSPIESLSTHCQLPFLSWFIDWEKVNNL